MPIHVSGLFGHGMIFFKICLISSNKITNMATKKILIIAGIGILTYFLFKKTSGSTKNSKPGSLKKFTAAIAHSITKPLEEVAEDVPSS